MKSVTLKTHAWLLLFVLTLAAAPAAVSQTTALLQGSGTAGIEQARRDSVERTKLASVDEMARRVDSLQFIVVYNAELLRHDLDSKVVWIYAMLGVMIIASMMMYGALNQVQRQRKELEERILNTLSSSVSDLEAKIKQVESKVKPPLRARRAKSSRKKQTV